MATEIERKFLVTNDSWKEENCLALGWIRQGYLINTPELTIRYRHYTSTDEGYITIKGPKRSMSCSEFEMKIDDKHLNIELSSKILTRGTLGKNRTEVYYKSQKFEVDEFTGMNAGLVVVEIELPSEDCFVDLPDWVGQEITNDKRYLNCNLIANPFMNWYKNGEK